MVHRLLGGENTEYPSRTENCIAVDAADPSSQMGWPASILEVEVTGAAMVSERLVNMHLHLMRDEPPGDLRLPK